MQKGFEFLVFVVGVSGGEETVEVDFRKRREFAVTIGGVATRKCAEEGVGQQRRHLQATHRHAFRPFFVQFA